MTSPASTTRAMVAGFAAAKTSAGAPERICCASDELAPKLNVTSVPGRAPSNSAPIRVNTSVSDAAAKTTISPFPAASRAPASPVPTPPHAVTAVTAVIATAAASPRAWRRTAVICFPGARRPRGST